MLASELEYRCEFIYTERKLPAPVRYLVQAIRTWSVIRNGKYSQVVVMLPPLPALLCVLAAGQPRMSVVGDLHTGFFLNPKWKWMSGLGLWLLRGSRAIVTNGALAKICARRGVDAIILHDVLKKPEFADIGDRPRRKTNSPIILCPLAYANDEPIESIIEAAESLSDVRFIFTGNAPSWIRDRAPHNIDFSGYVSNTEYWELLASCSGVLALTVRDFTMQRAGYEAMLAGKPHVTSDFATLREFYGDSAVYTSSEGVDIASAVREMLQHSSRLIDSAAAVLAHRSTEQREALSVLAGSNGSA